MPSPENTDGPVERVRGGDTPSVAKSNRFGLLFTGVAGIAGVVCSLCTAVMRDGIYEGKNERLTCSAIASGEDPDTQDFSVMFLPPSAGQPIVPSLSESGHTKLRDVVQDDVDLVVRGCRERYGIVVTPEQVERAVLSF